MLIPFLETFLNFLIFQNLTIICCKNFIGCHF